MSEVHIVYAIMEDGRRHALLAFADHDEAEGHIERCNEAEATKLLNVDLVIDTLNVKQPGAKAKQ